MFRNLAEDIAFLLIKSKVVDIKRRNVYVYGLEVLLLNLALIGTFLIVSMLFGAYVHFWAFLIFFIPLRIFSGGYHAETSEKCFILSMIMYIASLLTIKLIPLLYKSACAIAVGVIFTAVIFIFAPLVNKNNELTARQYARNKFIVRIILFFDLVSFAFCYFLNFKIAASELVFIGMVGVLLLIAKFNGKLSAVENRIANK